MLLLLQFCVIDRMNKTFAIQVYEHVDNGHDGNDNDGHLDSLKMLNDALGPQVGYKPRKIIEFISDIKKILIVVILFLFMCALY